MNRYHATYIKGHIFSTIIGYTQYIPLNTSEVNYNQALTTIISYTNNKR
jgi:hypothetical protein